MSFEFLAWLVSLGAIVALLSFARRLTRRKKRVEEGLCHCLERRHHSEASYRSWAQYEKDGNWERARVRYEQVLGQYHSFAREYSPELARTYLRSVLGYYAGYFREINDRPLFEGIHIDFLDPVQFIRSRLEDLERKEAGTGATRTQRPAPQGSSA